MGGFPDALTGHVLKVFIHPTRPNHAPGTSQCAAFARGAAILRPGFGGACCQTPPIPLKGEFGRENSGSRSFLRQQVRAGEQQAQGVAGRSSTAP